MISKLNGITKVNIFMSYAHEDEKYKEDLDIALTPLKRLEIIQIWDDREILPGENWPIQIDENLNNADIIILLISNNFIKSEYCYKIEMQKALSRANRNEAIIIPILLQHCLYEDLEFAKFEMLPKDATPIDELLVDKNKIYTDIAREIKKVIDKIAENKSSLFSIPDFDEILDKSTSNILKTITTRFGTEGIVRRFLKGSMYKIIKKGKGALLRFRYEAGDTFRVANSMIGIRYEAEGSINSILGFPISDERDAWGYNFRSWTSKGFVQFFEGGNIYFSEGFGAKIILAGNIRNRFAKYEAAMITKGEKMTGGMLGFPISDQYEVISKFNSKGVVQRFELGYIIDWSEGTFGVDQGFYSIYQSVGEWRGNLGFPKSEDHRTISSISKNSGSIQIFENGCTIWDSKSNRLTFIIGEIFRKWDELKDKLGFPINNGYSNENFTVQDFEGGRLKIDNRNKKIISEFD